MVRAQINQTWRVAAPPLISETTERSCQVCHAEQTTSAIRDKTKERKPKETYELFKSREGHSLTPDIYIWIHLGQNKTQLYQIKFQSNFSLLATVREYNCSVFDWDKMLSGWSYTADKKVTRQPWGASFHKSICTFKRVCIVSVLPASDGNRHVKVEQSKSGKSNVNVALT